VTERDEEFLGSDPLPWTWRKQPGYPGWPPRRAFGPQHDSVLGWSQYLPRAEYEQIDFGHS
jgi:hypothetical protein